MSETTQTPQPLETTKCPVCPHNGEMVRAPFRVGLPIVEADTMLTVDMIIMRPIQCNKCGALYFKDIDFHQIPPMNREERRRQSRLIVVPR